MKDDSDPLSDFTDKGGSGSDLFLRFKSDEPVKLRIFTKDPLVSIDQWGNTRFSFVVYNWDEQRPMILSKGASILKQLKAIHTDADYGDIRQLDIKITASGEGMETRYTVMPLPNSQTLTSAIIKEAQAIELDKVIKNGIRLSQYNDGMEPPTEGPVEVSQDDGSGYDKARVVRDNLAGKSPVDTVAEVSDDDIEEPIDLSDIPF